MYVFMYLLGYYSRECVQDQVKWLKHLHNTEFCSWLVPILTFTPPASRFWCLMMMGFSKMKWWRWKSLFLPHGFKEREVKKLHHRRHWAVFTWRNGLPRQSAFWPSSLYHHDHHHLLRILDNNFACFAFATFQLILQSPNTFSQIVVLLLPLFCLSLCLLVFLLPLSSRGGCC